MKKGRITPLKSVLWIAALAPLALLVQELFLGSAIVDDPVESIQHRTGTTALILLLITLSIPPIRKKTGANWLTRFRRPTGLFAFFYATLHAFSYFVFDQNLNASAIAKDVIEHPWVLAGFSAFVLLIPLAVTSTSGWIRRMGGKRWNRLHKLIYPISALVVLHFYWQVKADVNEPLIYAAILLVLFIARYRSRKKSLKMRGLRSPDSKRSFREGITP